MYLKLTSLLLVTVMTLCVFPLTALATDAEAPPEETTVTEIPEQATEETEAWQRIDNETHQASLGYDNPDIPRPITEIESRREENVKHFLLPDGTVEAIVYSNAVHRKDVEGEWKDIDNTLSANNAKAPNLYVTDDLRVAFAKSFSPDGQLFALNENGYGISMKLITNTISLSPIEPIDTAAVVSEVTVTNAERRSDKKKWDSVEEAVRVDNASSIRYSNVKANTDLEYVLEGNNVKENIIIKSAGGSYVYTFELGLSGLTPALREDGSISLSDVETGRSEYIIPAPYMFDADGEYSYDVYYTLTEKSEGVYTLKITADSEWINSEDRAFPVTVDPTLTINAMSDTYIDSGNPTSYNGSINQLWISSSRTTYIHTYIPELPNGADIMDARLYVAYYYYTNVTSNSLTAGAYSVNMYWQSKALTWNMANEYSNLGISTTRLSSATFWGDEGAYESTPKWVYFDITSAVRSWASGSTANNGIALKRLSGTNSSVILKSKEAGSYCPYFSINYTEPRIANGVYKIKNAGTGKYVDVTDRGTASGTQLQQWEGTATDGNRAQLFKVTFVTTSNSTNYYTIRALTNCELGMNIPSLNGTATVQSLSSEDNWSSLPWNQSISITSFNGNYAIKSGSNSSQQYLVAPSSGTNGTKLYSSANLNTNGLWIFEQHTPAIDGITFTGKFARYLIPNETFTYQAVMYSSTIGRNGPVTYSVKNEDGTATDKATINATTGELTALKTGTIRVCASYSGTSTYWYKLVDIEEDMSDTYFIKNAQLNSYMQIDDSVEKWDGGEALELWNFDGDADQKWNLEYISEGYYKILSTACGLAVTAPSQLDGRVLQNPYTGANNQLWRFVDEGENYSIVPKSSMANYLSAGFGVLITGGRNVELREEQDDNKDRWYLLDTHLTFPIRLLYDSLVSSRYYESYQVDEEITVEEWLEENFYTAVEPIKILYGIEFTIVSIEYSDVLNLDAENCHASDPTIYCTPECEGEGQDSSQCETVHHHSALRLLNSEGSEEYFTCRLVGYQLCYWDGNVHKGVNGLSYIPGTDSVVYLRGELETQNTILHEISHNLGASHCGSDECIMGPATDYIGWCYYCHIDVHNGISKYYKN